VATKKKTKDDGLRGHTPKQAPVYESFKDWFAANLPEGMTRTDFAQKLAAQSGGIISRSTVMNTLKGQRLTGYAKGKALSDLTGGSVPLERIVE
jgi:hypothetical protein